MGTNGNWSAVYEIYSKKVLPEALLHPLPPQTLSFLLTLCMVLILLRKLRTEARGVGPLPSKGVLAYGQKYEREGFLGKN